jgi:tetratricopeptide (TPR) repeat protein
MDRIRVETKRMLAMAMLLTGATLIAFWPSIHNDFVYFDEGEYLFNSHVKNGLSWANFRWAFVTGFASNWHPLTWLSHMLDVQLFGLNPAWHHAVSLVIHMTNAVLLLWLLKKLTGKPERSFFVAGLFALHPLHVESVAWAAERKDVLSTLFFMLTLLFYAGYVERAKVTEEMAGQSGREGPARSPASGASRLESERPHKMNNARLFYGLSLSCFALGLMSKPMLVTLPFVLLLLDYWPLRRFECNQPGCVIPPLRPLILEKVPFFCMTIASSVITWLVQRRGGAVWAVVPWNRRVVNAVVSYIKYLGKTFWPTDLLPHYSHPDFYTGQWGTSAICVATLSLVAISALCVVWMRKRPWLATGWFWYVGTLVPVIGLLQVGTQGMADRYTYIPLIGVFLALVWTVAEASRDSGFLRGFAITFGLVTLLVCVALSRHQVNYWHDGITAFSHSVAVRPFDAQAHAMLGGAYALKGQPENAGRQFRAAVALNPTIPEAHLGLGVLLAGEGKLPEAVEQYEKALRTRPGYGLAYKGLRAVHWRMGRRDEAVADSVQALAADPDDAQEHIYLGGMLWEMGKREQAVAQYREAVRIDPHDSTAAYRLGFGLSQIGLYREGAAALSEALRRGHQDSDTYSEYGRTLAALGDLEGALAQFKAAATLSPTNANLQVNFANALWMSGHTNEAASNFAAAALLQPGLAQETLNSGKALASAGQFAAALGKFSTAMRLHPDWPEAMSAAAWVLATAPEPSVRNGSEAVRLAERAAALTGKKDLHVLATLDAAYAEAGRFPEAITAVEETSRVALGTGNDQAIEAAKTRLERYQKGKPAHD